MRKYIALSSILFSSLVLAQELHTLSNGEVADAEKINENFNVVREQIEAISGESNAPISAWTWVDANGQFIGYGLPDNTDVFTRFVVDDYVYRLYEISYGDIKYLFSPLYFASLDCSGEPFLYVSSGGPSNFSSSPFGLDIEGYIHVAGEPLSETVETRSRTVRSDSNLYSPPTNLTCQETTYSPGVLRSTVPTGERHLVTHTEPIRLVWPSLKTSGRP